MNPTYKAFVRGKFKYLAREAESLHHAGTGVAGEGGELLDITKKIWIYNQTPETIQKDGISNREHLVEELGDLFFYATSLMDQLGLDLQQVLDYNCAKIEKRYPSGYSDKHALERLDKG